MNKKYLVPVKGMLALLKSSADPDSEEGPDLPEVLVVLYQGATVGLLIGCLLACLASVL